MFKTLLVSALIVLVTGAAFAAEQSRENVTFATSDNVTITGAFIKGKMKKGPAVLLVHMLGRSRADWDPILEKYLLPQTPFSYLTIDLRGHGESVMREGKKISYSDFKTEDWQGLMKDIAAAVKYLRSRPDVDGARIAIVGASIGANSALSYAAGDPQIVALALLSPGLNFHGIQTVDAMKKYGNRPVLMVAAREDTASAEAVNALAKVAEGKKVVEVFQGNLHGTKMFGSYPVDKLLVSFLNDNLK